MWSAAEPIAQSPSEIIETALVNFLNDAAETAEDARRWDDYLKTRKSIPIAAIEAWVESSTTSSPSPHREGRLHRKTRVSSE